MATGATSVQIATKQVHNATVWWQNASGTDKVRAGLSLHIAKSRLATAKGRRSRLRCQ